MTHPGYVAFLTYDEVKARMLKFSNKPGRYGSVTEFDAAFLLFINEISAFKCLICGGQFRLYNQFYIYVLNVHPKKFTISIVCFSNIYFDMERNCR